MNAKGKQSHFYYNQHIKYNETVKLDIECKGYSKFQIGKKVGKVVPRRCIEI